MVDHIEAVTEDPEVATVWTVYQRSWPFQDDW
jgi:hypothetical protein